MPRAVCDGCIWTHLRAQYIRQGAAAQEYLPYFKELQRSTVQEGWKSGRWQNPRQPRGVCHGFCWGQAALRRRCLAACGPRFL